MTIASSTAAQRKRSRYHEVHEKLSAAITDKLIRPGTVLLEGPLAEILETSRAPVRQALQMMLDEGLLSRFDGRGLVVGPKGTAPLRIDIKQDLAFLAEGGQRFNFAWQVLYEEVEAAVVHRSFFGRARVSELELARHFNVGRTVARDVLQQLEQIGLVEKDDSFRWAVVPLDDKRIGDLYDVREIIEPVALASACESIPVAEVDDMIGKLDRALHEYPRVSAAKLYDLELDLHVRCIDYSENVEFPRILQRTRCLLTSSKHVMGIKLEMPEFEPFMNEHRTVLKQVRAKDKVGLQLALKSHIHISRAKIYERAAAMRQGQYTDQFSFFS